jgi:hypothetical protein
MRVYAHNKTIKNQWCFAHLLRDFQACAQRDGPAQELAENLEVGTRWLLKLDRFHRYSDSKHSLTKPDRQRMLDFGNKLKRVFKIWLEKGSKIDGAPSWFRGLLADYDGMWTWLTHENVPLTNNAAERALRRSVIARKKSYGTQSTTGDNFVSRMRTATETLRRCKSNVFSFIHSSLMASLLHTKPPLLLT